ncbi:MAG: hypothetical protein J6N51_17575 [Selenomonas sp.]|nr:hypothetical protein [Selenomonas sp.]
MVELVNIQKNDEFISTEYIPEDSGEKGYIKMDLKGNVLESKQTSFDEIIADYFCHARRTLRKLLQVDDVPKKKLVMWY